MSAKQDKTFTRTAVDLERKYDLGKSFSEVREGIKVVNAAAQEAKRTAVNAENEARAARSEVLQLSDSITLTVTDGEPGHTAMIKLKVGDKEITGQIDLQGCVTFTNLRTSGATEINGDNITTGSILAALIKAGIIKSKDGSLEFDLDNGILRASGDNARIQLTKMGLSFYDQDGNLFFNVSRSELSDRVDLNLGPYNEISGYPFNLMASLDNPYATLWMPNEEGESNWEEICWKELGGVPIITRPNKALNAWPIASGGTGASTAAEARTNLGAAPDGYGLGSDGCRRIEGADAMDSALENGWYFVGGLGGASFAGVPVTMGLLHVHSYGMGWSKQKLYPCSQVVGQKNNIELSRQTLPMGGWGEWECSNPPMLGSISYCTMDRYLGNPVYKKIANGQLLWSIDESTWNTYAALMGAAPATEDSTYPGCYYRTVNGVKEWINPPMLLGVEYRTTERYGDKVVYKKLIAFTNSSALSGTASMYIPHGISNLDLLLSADIMTYGYFLPYVSADTSLVASAWNETNVVIYNGNSSWSSGRTWYVEMRYTKSS